MTSQLPPSAPAHFDPPPAAPVPPARRVLVAAVVVALVAAAAWFAWLGWDDDYYLVDGVEQGPYRPWQVIGAGVTVVVVAVAGYLWARRFAAVPVLALAAAIGFAVPWTVDAAASDDSGLFAVGLVLLLGGITVGVALVLGVVAPIVAAVQNRKRA